VALHGGRVEARSEGLGRGSEFCVTLPLAIDAPIGATEPGESAPSHPGRRILVVDDNADSADMMKALLEIDGHEVCVAYDPAVALRRAREISPDIGLLDIGMPGMSGYDLADALRSHDATANMYLIAVTGWGQPADRQKALASGFHAHLTKPAPPETLRALIRSATVSQPEPR
jgi:CheY-like chemotaxis protein